MYLCVWGLDFAFSYAFDSGFWNCSNSVVFFYFHFISNLKKKKKKKKTRFNILQNYNARIISLVASKNN
jgi:hypothetical protein